MARDKLQVCYQYANSGTCRFGLDCKFSHKSDSKDSSKRSKPARGRQSRKVKRQRPHADHIRAFFVQFPEFDHDPLAPVWSQFYRMCDEFGWMKEDPERETAREQFKAAMVQEFNTLFGTDLNNLDSCQALCRILDIQPLPEDIRQCHKQLRRVHVNLVDLVDHERMGAPVNIFPNLKKLQEYTIHTGKYFPREDAYAGGLLRFLLREITGTYEGRRRLKR